MMQLAELGERICVIGPSNSGKSTLADAIGRKAGLKVVHLDQLYHLPMTNWKPRPAAEFHDLHDVAIAGDRWVIDGNYSRLFAQRFKRATGIILLDISTVASLFRYVRRTLLEKDRVGGLAGGQDRIRLSLLHHIAAVTPGTEEDMRRYTKGLISQRSSSPPCVPSTRATGPGGWNVYLKATIDKNSYASAIQTNRSDSPVGIS